MAVLPTRSDGVSEIEAPLVVDNVVEGAVDYKGQPVIRSKSGYWRSARFIIGVEVAERCAYYGIESNLISYLTGPLHQSTATAAENVNVWSGTASLLPLLGAFIADSYLGRYRTIILASSIYTLGLGLLTLSAMLPSLTNSECQDGNKMTSCCFPRLQVIMLFVSLYLVAVGQGGHQPSVQPFGADQFHEQHREEYKARSSFFNWWYFIMCVGCMATLWILNYIQGNLSWVLGFGIPCLAMIIALLVFLLGTRTHRFNFNIQTITRRAPFSELPVYLLLSYGIGELPHPHHPRLPKTKLVKHFLIKILNNSKNACEEEARCSLSKVEEAKAVLRLVPSWATNLVYAIVFAQISTFFTKQVVTLLETCFPGLIYLRLLFKRLPL